MLQRSFCITDSNPHSFPYSLFLSLLLYAHFLLSTPNLQTWLKYEHAYYMPIGLYDLNNNLPFHILFERFSLIIIIILIEFNLYLYDDDDDDDAPKNSWFFFLTFFMLGFCFYLYEGLPCVIRKVINTHLTPGKS